MRWSTQIPPEIIENFVFILQPPRTVSSNAKSEAISSFQQFADFVIQLIYGDNSDGEVLPQEIEIFKKLLADDQLPMLTLQSLEKLRQTAKVKATAKVLEPSAKNGDNGDDLGFADFD